LNTKSLPVAVLIVAVTFVLISPILPVMGQIGSQIDQVFPTEQKGVVGQPVSLTGSIDSRNGTFQIYFGSFLVATGSAQDFSVSAGFRIPETPAGTYAITLRDVLLNNNATKDFTVDTAYIVDPIVPSALAQFQEGSIVVLNVSVTGGKANTAYSSNVTVTLPSPLNTNYSRLVTLPTSNQKGTATSQINFPDSLFDPSGSLTDFAGSYKVYFNLSQSLGSNQFLVGFTNLTQYHRGQTVDIRAIGYQQNDTTTVTIKNQESGATMYTANVSPNSAGTVIAEWTVPSSAAIGSYDVSITAHATPKLAPDQQNITVPGYHTRIRVIDLSGIPVPQIVVEANDAATNKTYSGTTEDDGRAIINLESGQHALTAFWKDLGVGGKSVNVVGEGEFDLSVELTNLEITVKDRNGLLIPYVNLGITYHYLTTKNSQQRTGTAAGQTDVSGMFTLASTPPEISYTINASIYGVTFNGGNDTLSNLPVKPVSAVTILCPSRSLTFSIIDYNRNPISDARLELLESSAGIFYGATTGTNGSVTVEATFGKYRARVYSGSVLLNETLVDAFTDHQIDVQCSLYNFQITVKVSDFFGQPISSANVRLLEPDGTVQSEKTQNDGAAIFSRVVGGDMQITAFVSETDDYYESRRIKVDSPSTIQIRMGRYIALGSLVIQTSLFVTIVIILPVIAIFLFIEMNRMRKAKQQKAKTAARNAGSK